MSLQTACVALLVVVASAGVRTDGPQAGNAANHLTPDEQRAGWTLLFDGRSLDGWRSYKRPDAEGVRWRVEDGFLTLPATGTGTGRSGDIISKDTYQQFELSLDWRVQKGGNSGVKYFVLEDRPSAIGHEYQLIDDEAHADAKVGAHRQTAAFYDVLPATVRAAKPAGEINTTRIVVRGKSVEHWLNGQRVLQYEMESPAVVAAIAKSKFKDVERFGKPQNGHILLQDHGDQVWYRNIKIRKL